MERNAKRALQITMGFLVVVVVVLAVSGVYLQTFVSQSFQIAEQIRVARALSFAALKDQLDEETGVRGFAATRETLFLEPYHEGRARFTEDLARLDAALDRVGLPSVKADVDEARRTNAAWLTSVADPLLESKSPNGNAVERRGKQLVDRYRAHISAINGSLLSLERDVGTKANGSIERVGAFVAVAIVTVILFALTFFMQQARLGTRLELARVRSEEQRRRTAELRASYDTEKRIADTLQEAFSQRPLPSVPLLRFSATYVPATEETKVGGDWYDALELPDSRVLFAIGDVAGHGIGAAVTMNRARQALVSSALLDAEPASVLARVNLEMLRDRAPMVTALAGFADAKTFEFVYASAGHPPPVLVEPGRPPRMLEFGSLPLGVASRATYRTHRVQSVPGAMLVLYTDGALEHSRNIFEGEALLLAAASQAGDAELDAASVIHNAIFRSRAVGDDVAILTIGFSRDSASGLTISAENAQATFTGRVARSAGGEAFAEPALSFLGPHAIPQELAS